MHIAPLAETKRASCHPEKRHYSKGLCATCYQANRRASKPEHREYMREYLKRYKAENPEKLAVHYQRRRADPAKRARDAISKRNSAYRVKYGITYDGFLALFASQNHACALCSKPLTEKKTNVDHCHQSGAVRGVLCSACNTGLGQLGDDETGLLRALEYVRRAPLTSAG